MSESREESPDWLRCFQAPTHSAVILLSGSESSPNESPKRDNKFDNEKPSLKEISESLEKDKNRDTVSSEADEGSPLKKNETSNAKSPKKRLKVERTPAKKKKVDSCLQREGNDGRGKVTKLEEKHVKQHAPEHSVWKLSSDSESCPDNDPMRKDTVHHEELSALETSQYPEKKSEKDTPKFDSAGSSPLTKASKGKSPRKRLKAEDELPREDEIPAKKKKLNTHMNRKGYSHEIEVAEEEISDKRTEPHLSSSRLPLVLSEKVHRSKALVECEGESIDLSGDMGSVGRVVISDNASGSHDMFLDLKGTIYKTTIVPSRTFCVVSFGQSEAKIEAIMNDFIQLKPQSNVYEAETMVEGTLDGFSFDSEDEAEKMPKASACQNDQNEGTVEQFNGKTKGKPEKTSGTARRRGKAAGKKPLKSSKKKTQASKKVKAKK